MSNGLATPIAWQAGPLHLSPGSSPRLAGHQDAINYACNEEASGTEKPGGAGRSPIASEPLDISWENGVILAFHSLVRLKFQLPEN